jgi:Fungal specific transcription factor domain
VESRRPVYGGTETTSPAGIDPLSSGTVGDDSIFHAGPRSQAPNSGSSLDNTSSEYSQSRLLKRPYSILAAHESDAPESYYSGSSTFPSILSPSQNGIEDNRSADKQPSATGPLQGSMGSYGLNHIPGGLESCLELPDRIMADNLVDAYFNRTHKLYPFLHEGLFRAEYETMWALPSSRHHSRLSWFGVLNMVFAHGCEHCDSISQDQVPARAAPFVSQSRNIILSQVFSSGTLETVQSLLLMCYYLQGTVELKESWNLAGLMIRTAISLGLHLNPRANDILSVEREVRKRSWWGCFVLDRTLSMKFGLPPFLRIEDGNVDLPLEVDDQYIISDSVTPRQPVGTPSFISLFVTTIKLSQIVNNMLVELYLRRPGTYDTDGDKRVRTPPSACSRILSKVMLLDGQLQSWWDGAPRHLTQQTTEGEQSWINFQRQHVALKIR